jgi:hypothetical protein
MIRFNWFGLLYFYLFGAGQKRLAQLCLILLFFYLGSLIYSNFWLPIINQK